VSFCKRCGNDLIPGEKNCSDCGELIKYKQSTSYLIRLTAICTLLIFIISGTGYLLYERIDTRAEGPIIPPPLHEPVATQEPLVGTVFDKEHSDSWEYPGGIMNEYLAHDIDGNNLALYYDQESNELKGFWIAVPPSSQKNIDLQQAQEIALDLVSQVPFFNDPDFTLLEAEYIDYGLETNNYYYFYWATVDKNSGAILLKHVETWVAPETGKVFYLNTHDGGRVNILTEPKITVEEAEGKALEIASEKFVNPRIEDSMLIVSLTENNQQRLVWDIYIEETGDPAKIEYFFCVVIDAITGEIVDTIF